MIYSFSNNFCAYSPIFIIILNMGIYQRLYLQISAILYILVKQVFWTVYSIAEPIYYICV